MATYVWCELICDRCNEGLAGQWESGRYIPRAQLKAEAEMRGAFFSGDEVFCRQCHQAEQRITHCQQQEAAGHEQ